MTDTRPASAFRTLAILSATQIISWGTLYYAFAIVARDIVRDLGLRAELVFGAFSWCLLVAGLAATPAGILIDRYGGRPVMAAGSLLGGSVSSYCPRQPARAVSYWPGRSLA